MEGPAGAGGPQLVVVQTLPKFRHTLSEHRNCFGQQLELPFPLRTSLWPKPLLMWNILDTTILGSHSSRKVDTLKGYISHQPPPQNPYAPAGESTPWNLRAVFIGVDELHASPYITIFCQVGWYSRAIRAMVKSSGLLGPTWGCLRYPALVEMNAPTGPAEASSEDEACKFDVYVPGRQHVSHIAGLLVEVWQGEKFIGKATIGGLVAIGSEIFGLTVAHVSHEYKPAATHGFDIDESELAQIFEDSVDYPEVDAGSDAAADLVTSHVSPRATQSSSSSSSGGVSSYAPQTPAESKTHIGRLEHIAQIQSAPKEGQSNLDWALVSFNHAVHPTRNQHQLQQTVDPITILTPSGPIAGKSVTHALFGIPMAPVPQSVLVTQIKSSPKIGESGSWAFLANEKEPIGMLIGHSKDLHECYLLQMNQILSDIELQTGFPASVAKPAVAAPILISVNCPTSPNDAIESLQKNWRSCVSSANPLEFHFGNNTIDAEYCVRINDGSYEVLFGNGDPLPNPIPNLPATAEIQTIVKLCSMLVHIQRYLELDQLRPSTKWGTRHEFELNEFGQGTPDAPRELSLDFRNVQAEPVWITILVLQPDWSVSPIIPGPGEPGQPVRGGQSIPQIRVQFPAPDIFRDNYGLESRDKFKMIISHQAHNFSHYELPSLYDFELRVYRNFDRDMPSEWDICEKIITYTVPEK